MFCLLSKATVPSFPNSTKEDQKAGWALILLLFAKNFNLAF